MRDQIWTTLCNVRFKSFCLGFLLKKYQKWDRNINVFLAVASSGSIAAWAIWKTSPMIWAIIIAISQVMTVIKPFFPYFKYVKEFNHKCSRMDLLNIEFERLWHKLQNKKINEDEAEEKYFDLRKQMTELFTFGDDTVFDVGGNIEQRANERMKTFLKSNYQLEININH